MTGETFVQIAVGIILICSALVAAYVVPYVQTKIDQQYLENIKELCRYAEMAVEWANQTIPAEQWEKKKHDVFISVKTYMYDKLNVELTDDQLTTIIEAFVNRCKKGNQNENRTCE